MLVVLVAVDSAQVLWADTIHALGWFIEKFRSIKYFWISDDLEIDLWDPEYMNFEKCAI